MKYNLPQAHRACTTMLTVGKEPSAFMPPNSCKDYVHDSVTHALYPEYARLWHVADHRPNPQSNPNLDNPGFVVYTSPKSVDKNAQKFAQMMCQVEDMLDLDSRTSTLVPGDAGKSDNSQPFIAFAPRFWVKSPIAMSAYLTFLRLAIRMRLNESFDSFKSRMLDKGENKHQNAGYFRVAEKNGNLDGLLSRSLACLNREWFSDWLLSSHSRGFAWYNQEADKHYPLDEQSLLGLRIEARKAELNNMHGRMDVA